MLRILIILILINFVISLSDAENYSISSPITEELLQHTAKVARILSRNDAHLLILAEAGDRHLDAIYAAATLQQAKVLTIQGGASYGLPEFYNDLKLAMQTAALEQQMSYLLIEHCWLSYVPDILKPIEALLEGSEILELFGDDLETVASALKQAAQLEGYQESLGAYFMKRECAANKFKVIFKNTIYRRSRASAFGARAGAEQSTAGAIL